MIRLSSGARLWLEWWLVLLAAASAMVALIVWHGTTRLDNTVYDLMLRNTTRRVDPRIVLVAIDDRSLQAEGRWPWPRARDAALLRALQAARPRAIALDMLLPPGDPREDQALAATFRGGAPVYLPVHFAVPGRDGAGFDLELPAPALRDAAAGLGHVNIAFDADGNVRHAWLTYAGGNLAWRHLAALLGGPAVPPDHTAPAPAGQLEARSPVLIAYAGPQGTFPAISATSLLHGEMPPELLHDRLVIVGATAAGLGDAYATPFGSDGSLMPGVEIQANLLNTLLTGQAASIASPAATALMSLVPLLILLLAMRVWPPRRSLPLVAGLIGGVALTSALLLALGHVWFAPATAMIVLAGVYPLWMWRRLSVVSTYMTAELERLDGERDPLERPRPDLSRADFVDHQMGLLRSAIDRERDLRRFFKDRVAQMPDAVIVTDTGGQVVLANHKAERLARDLTGAASLERIDTLLSVLEVAPGKAGLPASAAWPDTVFPCGGQVETADGRNFDAHFEPQLSAAGALIGMVIRLVDMTEAIRLQRQREDVLQLLSHDMRAPSAAIVALVDMMARDASAATALPQVRAHAERTLAMADDFVQLSRAELKPVELRPVDLVDVARVAADTVWPRATAKQVAIVLDVDREALWVNGEASLLVRTIVNLLDNALKFSNPGQQIRLWVRGEPASESAGEPALALCSVADAGPGIEPDRLRTIFEKFASAPAGPFRNLGGAGLGLAFVHTVAIRHRGRITCDSTPGMGATFTLELPALPGQDHDDGD